MIAKHRSKNKRNEGYFIDVNKNYKYIHQSEI